ncbi:transcriptional antiterminator, BglG family [Carnobacterium iners]|uniref:Transcriptional antiterminator, BglG family n=1 Tax=Carnobacterium iners TaxID=1073423 RepID=A0A1X7MQ57_9LACT|nr:BglG family transcription antiterminator [Carnobacterium iners]SEK78144.1 transcriptional antiterminator, BglG family [Carnobacterium iners]SMH26478.1 transcriptional antiterminator, BglG family [Carnobacterium iners]
MNKKEIQILEILFHNSTKYTTSQEIASLIGVSDKTSRKYMKQLDESIYDKSAQIKSTRGHGYRLIVHDDIVFKNFYRDNMNIDQTIRDLSYIEEPNDRQFFLLQRLFFENDLIYVEDCLSELFISNSTLINDITEMNLTLKPFDLCLKTSKQKGLRIIGDERSKRHFIISYFLLDRYQNNMKSFEQISLILNNISLEEILIIVLDEYRNQNLKLNDTTIFNITLHIALAIMRVEEGYQVSSNMNSNELNSAEEVQTAKNIINRLEQITGILLPDAEIYNIALHLKSRQSNKVLLDSQNINESELHDQIIEGLKKLERQTSYHYSEDSILINGLIAHFIPLIIRINSGSKILNPLLKEIKNNYKSLFEQTRDAFSNIKVMENKNISDDEWAYIALYVIASNERQMSVSKSQILVICATGLGSSQIIRLRLENELGSKIIIKDIISYYEITQERLKNIDLIVSSIDLSNIVFSIPIVNVSVLLNEEDIKAINNVISSNVSIDRDKSMKFFEKSIDIKEITDEYFDSSLFVFSNEITNREEAIDVLINKSVEQDNSIDKIFLKNQLKLREKFSSVVFSKDIAVPHPMEGASNKSKVAVLITPNGINWDLNNKNIRMTLLLLPDRFGNQQIELVSKAILPILECQTSIDALVSTRNYKDFKKKLIQILK